MRFNTSLKDLVTKARWPLFVIGIAVVSITAGYYLGLEQGRSAYSFTPSETHLGRINYTNPLLSYTSRDTTNPLLRTLKQTLTTEATAFTSQQDVKSISIFFQELDSGEWFGINETEPYAPASLMKVTLMLAYYKLAESNPDILKQTITYQGHYAYEANIPPAQRLAYDRPYTIDELLYHMIVYSDNEARSLLSDYLDANANPEALARLVEDTVLIIPANYERGDMYEITAENYARAFRVLYNATYLSDGMSERALALLAESSYDSGIVNGVAEGTVVANKFGFSNNPLHKDQLQFHDCGIVYNEPNPYLLCILTKTNNVFAAQKVISKLSKTVFEHLKQE